ncbi:hypothetical protein BJX61DRAFT_500540 [Aspergillus egyptiacus]|nr:hypothetical protein BJX61DRAFT_500540 [Aspergillus egyptiacus]
MSQETEPQLSQGSLAPPVEIPRPRTPVQRAALSASSVPSVRAGSRSPNSDHGKFISPPSLPSSDMTPPPSTQIPGAPLRRSRSRSSSYLAPSPDIEETLCAAYGASENLPTVDDIDRAEEVKLRAIAKELLGIAREARVSALHFKLQYGLLSFRSSAAIKRAEVEHKLARREAEILQSTEYRNRYVPPEEPVPQISNVDLELASKRQQELERVNTTLDRRLRRAKKLIEQEKDKSDLLEEENQLLKKRIRENREHFSRMIERGPMSPIAHAGGQTPHRRTLPQFVDTVDHDVHRSDNCNPFAALLAADRVLNREPPSVASTPNRQRAQRQYVNGHVRGSHSISSLPVTPSQPRKVHQETQYATPGRESSDEARDRDSTISASDIEEAETEEDIPASQAGSPATSMLRRNPPGIQRVIRTAADAAPKSSTLLQTKLFGQVRKAGVERPPNHLKRKASFDVGSSKKSKAGEQVGLGIH